MRRLIWIAMLIGGAALVGCDGEGGRPQPPTPEDTYSEARAEWESAAEQGDARSQRQLGVSYYLGQGAEKDHAKALEWFDKAAAQGEDTAQYLLGVMYAEGQGVPQDNVQAYMWFSLSAEQDNPGAGSRLEKLAELMTSTEIAEAQKLAAEWTPTF